MKKDYGMKTQFNPRLTEENYIAVGDYLAKNGWKHGISYSGVIQKMAREVVIGTYDKSFVIEYNLFDEEVMYKVDNKTTQISTSDKRALVKVAKSKQSTMTELINDQIKRHMVLVAKR